MKKASDYRQHAQECLALAKQVPEGEHRNQLLEMARTWENLADTRDGLIHNHPELNTGTTPAKAQPPSKQ
jgi:hypothetical protein